jgi:hypothetical protein
MKVEFENIETLFTYQLQAILDQTEAEIVEVKNQVKLMGEELEVLGKEPGEDDMIMVDMAAQFVALANKIKYTVKAELNNRQYELN